MTRFMCGSHSNERQLRPESKSLDMVLGPGMSLVAPHKSTHITRTDIKFSLRTFCSESESGN